MVDKTKKPSIVVKKVESKTVKESKEQYFIRIAEPRVKNILKALRILGNCSNRTNYAYTSEQIELIDFTLTNALTETMSKFTPSKKEQEAFKF